MNPVPSLIEEMAKALAFSKHRNFEKPLRWPEGPDDTLEDRDGSVPFTWSFVVECRKHAQAIVKHLAPIDTFDYEDHITELDRAAFDVECGLVYPSTPMTFAFRRALYGEGHDVFLTAGYQWTDKPHRLLFDACVEIERQAHLIAE